MNSKAPTFPRFDKTRAFGYLASAAGATVSWQLTHGAFDVHELMWSAVVIVGVVQLHLLLQPPQPRGRAAA